MSSKLISSDKHRNSFSDADIQMALRSAIQDMHLDEAACNLLMDKWQAFVGLPYSLRLLLETGGYMDCIQVELLRSLVHMPEDEIGKALDEAIPMGERVQMRRSGQKRPVGDNGDIKLLDAPVAVSWTSLAPSKLLKNIFNANGMRWDPSITSWVQLVEPYDEKGQIRQTRLNFLPNGEVSPSYFSIKESNLIQRCRYLGSADRWLELQVQQHIGGGEEAKQQEFQKRLKSLTSGFILFGRFYELGWYKFERLGKYPRLFFFATRSMGPQPLPELPNIRLCSNNVLFAARDLYGRSCRYIAQSKLPARLELLWSKTFDVPLDPSTKILYCDDLYGDNLSNLGESLSLMTDGAGLCSEDIAMRVPIVSSGKISELEQRTKPGVMQVRIWDDRSSSPIGIKGCLIPTRALPPNTIVITRSMVKAPNSDRKCRYGEGPPSLSVWLGTAPAVEYPLLPGLKAKDINHDLKGSKISLFNGPSISLGVTTSTWCVKSPARVNRTILLLLDRERPRSEEEIQSEGGRRNRVIRDFFSTLMKEEAMELGAIKTTFEGAVRAANKVGGAQGDLVLQYLAAAVHERIDEWGRTKPGFHPCLYLMTLLHQLEEKRLEQLKKMNLETPDTCMGVGVPDLSGTIPYGCIVVIGRDGRPLFGEVTRKVLVYRHPCLGEKELAACRSIAPPEKFFEVFGASPPSAVYFSVHGEKSVAMQLATGDFDGDEYLVIATREIVDNFKPHPESDFFEMACRRSMGGSQPQMPAVDSRPRASLSHTPVLPQSARRPVTRSASQEQSGNHKIVPTAASCTSQAPKTESEPCEVTGIIVNTIIRESMSQIIVSMSKVRWDYYADAYGAGCHECVILANLYAESLDAVKSGGKIKTLKDLPDEKPPIRAQLSNRSSDHWKPVWEQTGIVLKHSTGPPVSIAEELFFVFYQVNNHEKDEYWKDPSLLEPDCDLKLSAEQFSKLSKDDRDIFNESLEHWMKMKIQWGAAWQDAGSPLDRKYKASVAKFAAVKKDRSQAILEPHRAYLWEGTVPCPVTGIYDSYKILRWRAMALYTLCYNEAAKSLPRLIDEKKQPNVNFAWQVAGDVLRDIKVSKRAGRSGDQRMPSVACRSSGLMVKYRLGKGKMDKEVFGMAEEDEEGVDADDVYLE